MQRSEGKGLGSSFDHGFLRKGKASGLRTGSPNRVRGLWGADAPWSCLVPAQGRCIPSWIVRP